MLQKAFFFLSCQLSFFSFMEEVVCSTSAISVAAASASAAAAAAAANAAATNAAARKKIVLLTLTVPKARGRTSFRCSTLGFQ